VRFAWVAPPLLALSVAAQADWQLVQWGMSPEAVIAAGGGEISAAEDAPGKRIQSMSYLATSHATIDGIAYQLNYFFKPKDKQLALINFVPAKTDCDAALASHIRQFGDGKAKVEEIKGLSGKPPIVTTKYFWKDSTRGDHIEAVDVAVKEYDIRYCQFLHSK
jgi:hypothetical protein